MIETINKIVVEPEIMSEFGRANKLQKLAMIEKSEKF